MMRIPKVTFSMVLVLSTVLSAGALFAQYSGQAVTKSGQISEDIYAAGGTVQMLADVEGDVVAAGGVVNIANSVSEDVLAAGGIVSITANTGDDVRSAGGSVAILGNVADDVVAAGGSVTLESTSTVGGRAWLAGGIVKVAGNVRRELRATGGEITLSGTVGGDVEIYADSIEIEPSAVIKGKLTYSAPNEAVVHEGAVIEGEVNRQEFDLGDFDTWGAAITDSLLFYLSVAISAIVLFLIYPHSSAKIVQRLREAPLKSLGLGLLVLIVTPILAIVLLVSVLAIPLGLIALTVYFVALIAGLLVGITWIGDAGFRLLGRKPDGSNWTRVWSIAAGAAILLVIDFIPYVGGFAFFIVLLLGIGALKLHSYRWYVSGGDGPVATS